MLEQIKLADILVHYDDVQFSKGSFTNRVQVKTSEGSRWLTVPVKKHELHTAINRIEFKPAESWQNRHIALLEQSFAGAPYINDALEIVSKVYETPHSYIGDLARHSMMEICTYFDLLKDTKIVDIADLNINGSSSKRVFDTVKKVDGDVYITGHGAKKYLDHDLFVSSGIDVQYMNYRCHQYPQLHGEFTPYVSALDLIANCGKSGIDFIKPETVSFREVLNGSN